MYKQNVNKRSLISRPCWLSRERSKWRARKTERERERTRQLERNQPALGSSVCSHVHTYRYSACVLAARREHVTRVSRTCCTHVYVYVSSNAARAIKYRLVRAANDATFDEAFHLESWTAERDEKPTFFSNVESFGARIFDFVATSSWPIERMRTKRKAGIDTRVKSTLLRP